MYVSAYDFPLFSYSYSSSLLFTLFKHVNLLFVSEAVLRFEDLYCVLSSSSLLFLQLKFETTHKVVEQCCCSTLVDKLTYINQLIVYFRSILIYLPDSQSKGKQDCARKAQRHAHMTSIPLLFHFSSHSLRPRHAGLLCKGLPVGPLPESRQSTATADWPWDRGSRKGPLSQTEPQVCTDTKYCFTEEL